MRSITEITLQVMHSTFCKQKTRIHKVISRWAKALTQTKASRKKKKKKRKIISKRQEWVTLQWGRSAITCGQIRILKHDKSLLKTSHTKARRTTNDPNNAYKHKILQTLIWHASRGEKNPLYAIVFSCNVENGTWINTTLGAASRASGECS